MDWNDIFKNFLKKQLPTLVIIGMLLWCAMSFLKDSEVGTPNFYAGCVILVVGLVLILISYSDYRNREHLDKIQYSYEKLINRYDKALGSINQTGILRERIQQETLKSKREPSTGKDFVPVNQSDTTEVN